MVKENPLDDRIKVAEQLHRELWAHFCIELAEARKRSSYDKDSQQLSLLEKSTDRLLRHCFALHNLRLSSTANIPKGSESREARFNRLAASLATELSRANEKFRPADFDALTVHKRPVRMGHLVSRSYGEMVRDWATEHIRVLYRFPPPQRGILPSAEHGWFWGLINQQTGAVSNGLDCATFATVNPMLDQLLDYQIGVPMSPQPTFDVTQVRSEFGDYPVPRSGIGGLIGPIPKAYRGPIEVEMRKLGSDHPLRISWATIKRRSRECTFESAETLVTWGGGREEQLGKSLESLCDKFRDQLDSFSKSPRNPLHVTLKQISASVSRLSVKTLQNHLSRPKSSPVPAKLDWNGRENLYQYSDFLDWAVLEWPNQHFLTEDEMRHLLSSEVMIFSN